MIDDVAPKFEKGEKLKVYGWARKMDEHVNRRDGGYGLLRDQALCSCFDGATITVVDEYFMTVTFVDVDGTPYEIYKAQCRRVNQ